MKIIFLFFCFFVFCHCSIAQNSNGIIVNTNLDTIYSEVIFPAINRTNNEYIITTRKNGNKLKVHASGIVYLKVGGIVYKSLKVENSFVLGKCISCDGYLQHLTIRPQNSAQYSINVLVKKEGSMIEIPIFSFKSVVANFLSDCPKTYNLITKEGYGKKDLDAIIINYNNCKIKELEELTSSNIYSLFLEMVNSSTDIDSKNKFEINDIVISIKNKSEANEYIPEYLIGSLEELIKGKGIEQEAKQWIDSVKNEAKKH